MRNKLNYLIIGGHGGLGQSILPILQKELQGADVEFRVPTRKELDVNWPTDLSYFEDVDVLIYMAALNRNGFVHKISREDMANVINTNCLGLLTCIQEVLPGMRKRESGSIINISSVMAHQPLMGTGIYSASKSFGETIIKTVAKENGSLGISANSIALGYFEGGMTDTVPEEILTKQLERVGSNRLGKGEELAQAIIALTSIPFLNGTTINLDGGLW